jgi:hypothetical protein
MDEKGPAASKERPAALLAILISFYFAEAASLIRHGAKRWKTPIS